MKKTLYLFAVLALLTAAACSFTSSSTSSSTLETAAVPARPADSAAATTDPAGISSAATDMLRPAAAHGTAAPEAGLSFTPPREWTVEPVASANRRAQYRLARAAGDGADAELVVYHFPGGGGTTQANIERWVSQFATADGRPLAVSQARVTQRRVGALPLTLVDVSGSYTGSLTAMMMAPDAAPTAAGKPGYRMLAAIVETDAGPWFFKLTGPEKTVGQWEASFNTFLDSIH